MRGVLLNSLPRLRGRVGVGEAAHGFGRPDLVRGFPHPGLPPQAGEGGT
jgi:hypothetical protein